MKRTYSNDENNFTYSKFSKDSLNKTKRYFNKFNDQFNSQLFNQREIRDNIKRKRERNEITRFKNIICYDYNKNVKIEKSKKE